MKYKKMPGHIALLFSNIIFGINTPISRSLMPEILSPFALTFFRLSGGMILFWLVSLFVKTEKVPAKDILLLFFASFFSLTFNQLPYFIGLSMTSSINASIVVTMLPILTMLLAALFLKEPITLLKAIGVLVGASGALLLVLNGPVSTSGKGNIWGDVIVILGVTSFAIYLTLFKNLISRYSPITVMKWMFLFATIVSFPFCYSSLIHINFAILSPNTYWRISYMVIFATFLGYLLIPIGQKLLRPTTLSMYNYIQPIVTSIVAVLIGIDTFGYEHALSGLLVFSGVYIVTQSKSKAQMEAEKINKSQKSI
jgi:drug/metabolite transporter (DMT)-like permease